MFSKSPIIKSTYREYVPFDLGSTSKDAGFIFWTFSETAVLLLIKLHLVTQKTASSWTKLKPEYELYVKHLHTAVCVFVCVCARIQYSFKDTVGIACDNKFISLCLLFSFQNHAFIQLFNFIVCIYICGIKSLIPLFILMLNEACYWYNKYNKGAEKKRTRGQHGDQ